MTDPAVSPSTDPATTRPGTISAAAPHDPRLTNKDLAPLEEQTWSSYNIAAFWMSDVHSVGGYVTAGSLFALGLTSWQVFVCLLVGICIVQFVCNLVARPSQSMGIPYPVVSRAAFGVRGANIPALIRGGTAVAWYGVQTFLAASSLSVIVMKVAPGLTPYADTEQHGFLGLSALGYVSFAILWVAQALVFWRGMDAIRKFIDFCGPAVYVAMLAICVYLVARADWRVSLTLTERSLSPEQTVGAMLGAIALVVSYFAGPMLNFGDFSRYGRSFEVVKRGNFWGLPVNFTLFSVLVVITASATVPVFGTLITDPVQTVQRIDTFTAVILGGVTFVIATVGINIVANFISPAFDFSHVAPQRISWRTGGMIAAVGSVLLMPWNWYNDPDAVFWTLGILGALIGPLFGVMIADYYVLRRRHVQLDDLFSMNEDGAYFYRGGYHVAAVTTIVVSGTVAVASVVLPHLTGVLTWLPDFSWFVGCGLAFVGYVGATVSYVPGTSPEQLQNRESPGRAG